MTDAEEPTGHDLIHPAGPAVVGIGASAGGLRALKEFFATVPADSGLAFVVVVHLAADHESHLAELLQPHSLVPVEQVTGPTAIRANHVYVIPPGRNLSAVDSHLRLAPLEERRADRAPIDHFFRTLADTHDGCSVGLILSGSGSDGKQGVRHIRAGGGLVVVQDPAEAEFDSMPRSAIETGMVDLVLPIPEVLPHVLEFAGTHPRVPVDEAAREESEDDLLQKVLTLLRLRTGHDFLRYKRSTVARRVARRMQLLNLESLPDYIEVLRESPDAPAALLDDLLINVTRYFRDPEVFQAIQATVIPRLFEGKGAGDRVRIWSVGCATGEEAYSLGMLLLEEADRHGATPQVQVFATDLHERSLRIAREALYPESIADEISPERLRRFFREEEGGYRVCKQLRDTVVFAVHNFLGDPPFSKLDLIVCRNVLIYLQRGVQGEVVDTFHYALRGGGFLLVGSAETLDYPDLFRVESKEHHLYRRRDLKRGELRLPGLSLPPAPLPRSADAQPLPRVEAGGFGALHQRVVERYAPPSLLLSATHEVVHLSEHAGAYLRHPGGIPTSNVFMLVREEFRSELRTTLHLAREQGEARRSAPVTLRIDGEARQVVLRVSPAREESLQGLFLVIFDEIVPSEPPPASPAGVHDEVVRELEAELELTRNRLLAIVEEFETSQEEMRASNEELQSANEELRSTMEELETSREELQSTNEELHTLNQENRHKVEELSQLSGDLHNLLQATDVATLFLDRSLRILRYTPRVSELFNVRPSDRGRPLADLTHRLGYGGLIEEARRVLQTLVPIEHEVEGEGGGLLLRIMPYRTVDDHIEGVVITLIDVSALKSAEEAVRRSEERQRFLLRLSDALRPLDDPAEIQQQAVRVLGEHLKADRAFYAIVRGDGPALTIQRDFHAAGVASAVGQLPAATLGVALLTELRAGRTARVHDVRADPRLTADEREGYPPDVAALVGVPLVKGDRWAALLCVQQRAPREWTPDEVSLVEDVAERTWAAVERARVEADLRESEGQRAFLLRLSDRLRPLTEPQAILCTAAEMLARHLGAAAVHYAVVGSDGESAVIEAGYNDGRVPELVQGLRFALSEFGAGWGPLLRSGTDVFTEDTEADARQLFGGESWGYGRLAATALPLLKEGRLVAWLSAVDAEPRPWTTSERQVQREVAERTWDAVERARAEAARRESEGRFRAIVEGALDYAILTLDPDGRILSWSPGAETVFGWSAGEAIGRDVSMTFTPDDRARGEDREEREAARREGAALDVRWHERKDGTRVFVEGTMRALDDGAGGVRGFLKIGQNLTQRREIEEALRGSEARFQTLVQNIRDYAIFMLDPAGLITHWTEGAGRVTGYTAGEVVGRHLAIFYTPEEIASGQPERELAEAEATGRSEIEDWRVRKGGERFWANEIATAVRDDAGALVGFTKISRDLTERKQAEEALRQLNETLEERVNERTASLGEINEALNEEVAQRVQAEEGRRAVLRQLVTAEEEERRRISRELHDSMGQLVTGLMLGLRSLEAAGPEADARIRPLVELADRIAREMQHLAVELRPPALDNLGLEPALRNHLEEWCERSGIGCDFHAVGMEGERLPPEIEITVYRVVQEGLTNVLKHSGATHVTLVLERRGGMVSAILEDNGRGFDVEETLARPDKAKRLGVRGMRERVALLGGALEIESSPGVGTSLFVRLAIPTEER